MRFATVKEYIQAAERLKPCDGDDDERREHNILLRRLRECLTDNNRAWAEKLYGAFQERRVNRLALRADCRANRYAASTENEWSHDDVSLRYGWPKYLPGIPGFLGLHRPRISHKKPYATPEDVDAILPNAADDLIDTAYRALHDPPHVPPHHVGEMPAPPEPPEGFDPHNPMQEPKFSDYENWLTTPGVVVSHKPESVAAQTFGEAIERWRREQYFLADYNAYCAHRQEREQALAAAIRDFEGRVAAGAAANEADRAELAQLMSGAERGDDRAVCRLVRLCHSLSPLPAVFPRNLNAAFDDERSLLVVEVEAPCFDQVPLRQELMTKVKPVSKRVKVRYQETVLRALPLRVLHSIFSCQSLAAVDMIAVNVVMDYVEPRDGQTQRGTVASICVGRDAFAGVNVRAVDPKACFRALKGIAVPNVQAIIPVPAVLAFGADRRVIEAQPIIDGLTKAANLAAMEWDEFEHLVRELFAKEFVARSAGAEVRVTRASRDWGVDAIIFDPDPLLGGKFVIQAKRWTNTIDVGAVRDLYGTVVNEGANRGILVTTSSFGPDAYEFVQGKPLSLLDGANLLALLRKHGYNFTIDLAAAKALRAAEARSAGS